MDARYAGNISHQLEGNTAHDGTTSVCHLLQSATRSIAAVSTAEKTGIAGLPIAAAAARSGAYLTGDRVARIKPQGPRCRSTSGWYFQEKFIIPKSKKA